MKTTNQIKAIPRCRIGPVLDYLRSSYTVSSVEIKQGSELKNIAMMPRSRRDTMTSLAMKDSVEQLKALPPEIRRVFIDVFNGPTPRPPRASYSPGYRARQELAAICDDVRDTPVGKLSEMVESYTIQKHQPFIPGQTHYLTEEGFSNFVMPSETSQEVIDLEEALLERFKGVKVEDPVIMGRFRRVDVAERLATHYSRFLLQEPLFLEQKLGVVIIPPLFDKSHDKERLEALKRYTVAEFRKEQQKRDEGTAESSIVVSQRFLDNLETSERYADILDQLSDELSADDLAVVKESFEIPDTRYSDNNELEEAIAAVNEGLRGITEAMMWDDEPRFNDRGERLPYYTDQQVMDEIEIRVCANEGILAQTYTPPNDVEKDNEQISRISAAFTKLGLLPGFNV